MAVLNRPRPVRRLVVVVLTAVVGAASDGAPQGVSEPALKAAFLLNFAKFAEWPADVRAANAPLLLCSADQSVSPLLERTVAGQTIQQHPLSASHVTLDGPLHECAVLYVGKVEKAQIARLIIALNGAGVLIVGDEQAFASEGGMIGLFVEDGRMRFAINITAAERGRIKLSAKLLTLARIVKD